MEKDTPILQEDGYYLVYTTNSNGDDVKVRFKKPENVSANFAEENNCSLVTDKSLPDYWRCKLAEIKTIDFKQVGFFDMATKKLRSVRDGVQEYLGIEIGMEPSDRVFTVYRSPETITNIVKMMDSLPVIEDHISPDINPSKDETIGIITDTDIVEFEDKTFNSKLVLENKVSVSDKVLELVKNGKKELSLGYMAKVRQHDVYDFEQFDISPRHLAIVDSARGGAVLKFLDKNKESQRMELEKMLMLASQFSELLKKSTAEELADYVPFFEKIAEKITEEKKDDMDGMESKEEEVIEDEEIKEEIKVEDEEEKEEEKFEDAVMRATQEHIATVEKARQFLDASYNFAGKKSSEIKKAALKAYGVKVDDKEVDIAFKLLKKSDTYKNFGDNKQVDAWASLADKEF